MSHRPEESVKIIPLRELRQNHLQKRIKEYIVRAESKRNPDGMISRGILFRKEFQPVWKIAELVRRQTESKESNPITKDYLLTDSMGRLYVQTCDKNKGKPPKREIYDRHKHGDLDQWIDVDELRAMEREVGMLKIVRKRPRK